MNQLRLHIMLVQLVEQHDPIELNTNFAVLANSVIEIQQALMNMGLSK